MRRGGNARGIRGGQGSPAWGLGGGAIAWTPASLASLATWHRADLGITLNSGNVSGWADQKGSANGSQATAAQQPLYVTSDAALNSQSSIDFDASDDSLALGSASSFNHIHNGTGGTFWIAFRSQTTLADSMMLDNNTGYSGAGLYIYQNAVGSLEIRIGTGSTPVFTSTAAVVVANTKNQLLIKYSSSASPNWVLRLNKAATASGAEGLAPSSGDAGYPLRLSADAGGGSHWGGSIAEIATFTSYLSAGDQASLEAYGSSRYGI